MKDVLVAVDGSKPSEKAFEYALEEAEELNNHLTVLRVVPGLGYAGDEVEGALAEEVKDAEVFLEGLKEEASERDIEIDTEVITGENIHTEIVKFAERGDYDLIVVGGSGKSDLGTIHLGSVSEGVAKRAHCPVLVVR